MSEYYFCRMSEKHLDEVHLLETELFSVPWSKQMFNDGLKNPNFFAEVCLLEGKVVAYFGVYTALDEADIAMIAVSTNHQNAGLGTRTLLMLIELCRGKQIKTINLEVRESNAKAIRLYEKLNFKYLGRRKNYYQGIEDARIYKLEL